MNPVLTQRKYRFAIRLSTNTAKTYGTALIGVFLALAIASAVLRAVYRDDMELSYFLRPNVELSFFLLSLGIPIAMTAIAWTHLSRSYPAAIAGGMTRKEFLTDFALFGAATVLATAVLTQVASQLLYPLVLPRGAEQFAVFYGLSLLESVVRPALYFAVGAASAAVMHRIASRTVGAVASGLMCGAVIYRGEVVWPILTGLGRNGGFENLDRAAVLLRTPDLAFIDAALAAVFILVAALVLARAPMRAKPA